MHPDGAPSDINRVSVIHQDIRLWNVCISTPFKGGKRAWVRVDFRLRRQNISPDNVITMVVAIDDLGNRSRRH